MKVDVSVATRNNAGTIRSCIRAIRDNIPVNKLIIVDGGSTDETVRIAKSLGADVVVNSGLLGSVRYLQAQQCRTQWIAIVDSDVYVYPNWWPEVSKYVNDHRVGMILAIGDSPMNRFRIYGDYIAHIARRFGTAAFSNTLVRRKLILSCHELTNRVHAGEDTIFARYLTGLGMRIVTVQKRLVYHDKNIVDEHPRAFLRWGKSLRMRGGLYGARELAKTLKNSLRNWWVFTRETRTLSLRLLVYLVYLWFCTFVGYVRRCESAEGSIANYS
jgi:glycosyltransferase involved in cell wall biosynthesis